MFLLKKILLGIVISLVLFFFHANFMQSTKLAYAKEYPTFRNTAVLAWTDGNNNPYVPSSDTAQIKIVTPPSMLIAKDVRNLRTGETSTDVVSARKADTIEFIINITNSGDVTAKNIVIIDTIPSGTTYNTGSALNTESLDPVDPPDTITFKHIAGGEFDNNDQAPVIAIKWQWDSIEGVEGYNKRIVKFKVKTE